VACDIADILAGIAAHVADTCRSSTTALVSGTALSGVVLGAAVLREQ
jgi:hypothetical protein